MRLWGIKTLGEEDKLKETMSQRQKRMLPPEKLVFLSWKKKKSVGGKVGK